MAGGFVGRTIELQRILRACRRGRGIVLTGGAGVGKSRLLLEAAQGLAGDGWRVEALTGSYGTRAIPLGALAGWLPNDPPASQALLFATVLQSLVGEADDPAADRAPRHVVVTADDAHLLDDTTIAVLTEALRRPFVTVLLSVRTPAEIPPSLHRFMTADDVTVTPLGPLSANAIGDLAADILGGSVAEDSLAAIVDVVRGNPLYLRELLADGTQTGLFTRRDSQCHLDGELRAGERVSELIRARARRLPAELVTLLDTVAVAEPLPLTMTAVDTDTVAELERHRLVRLESGPSGWMITLDHPLVGEALRQSMTTAERLDVLSALCRSVTDVADRPPGIAARSTTWFRELGETIPADIAADGAWEALIALDFDRAVELAAPATHLHWRAAFAMAEVTRARGDLQASARWHDRAAALADDDDAIRLVAMNRAALLGFHLSDPKAAIDSLLDAAAQVADDHNSLELQCEAAFHATLLGEFSDSVATCRAVLARDDLDELTVWTAGINFAYSQVMLGDVDDLDAALVRARSAIAAIHRDHPAGADLHAALSIGSGVLHGRLRDAISIGERSVTALGDEGAHHGMSAAVSTEALLAAGDPRAIDYALASVQQLRIYDPYNSLPYGIGFAALVAATRGEVEEARRLLDEVDPEVVDLRSRSVLGRAQAALASHDDFDRAAALASDAGALVVEGQHVSFGIFCLFDGLAYGPSRDRAQNLANIAKPSSSPYLRAIAECAAAVAAGDADRAAASAELLDSYGASGLSASALMLAAGLHPDAVTARRLAARAAAIALVAGWELPLWRTPEVDGLLSSREVEVAVAACSGQSDREIADRVFLSARTVGNHLHRAYGKLGIAGRDELATVFSRP